MRMPLFTLERFFAQYEHAGHLLLCASGVESLCVDDLFSWASEACESFSRLPLGYIDVAGPESLRTQIASLYSNVSPDRFLVHTGAAEAIFNTLNALLSPGDHVVVHYPCYGSLHHIAEAIGCEISLWEASPQTRWALDPEALKRMIRPNTKVIIVNVPHNPTGYVMPLAEWQALVDLARQSGIYILADEVYRFLEHAPLTPLPSMVDMYERGIAIGSMSKAFAMPGLRLGWVATQDTALLNAIAAFKDYTSICINAPGAFLAELALVHKETIFARNHAILDHNRQVLSDFLNAHRSTFNWVPPQAGATVFVGLNAGQSSERFCAQLLAQQNVLLLPSRYYDYPDGFFRLGFGARNFPAVLQKLAAFLESAHLSV